MSKPLTTGEKNRRANIRAMKAIGVKNAKLRAAAKVEAFLAHVDRNNAAAEQAAVRRAATQAEHVARNEDRRVLALVDRDARIAAGIAKRDAHNAALHADKVRTLAGELLAIAEASEATSKTAQSPVTSKVYAMDARHKRGIANDLLAGIGEPLARAA